LVFKGLFDPEFTFYSDEAWYTSSGYVNSQNNRYWSTENPNAVHEVLLQDLEIQILCVIGMWTTVQPVSFQVTVNSERYVRLIL
jgi:hypothetical protein